jgi:hypothetical protein
MEGIHLPQISVHFLGYVGSPLKSNTSVCRNYIYNTIDESSTSTIFLDIGTEVMNFMGGVI